MDPGRKGSRPGGLWIKGTVCIWALGGVTRANVTRQGPCLEGWLPGSVRDPSVDVEVPVLSPALTQQPERM